MFWIIVAVGIAYWWYSNNKKRSQRETVEPRRPSGDYIDVEGKVVMELPCPNCAKPVESEFRHCPHCGAKMK